MVHSKLLLSLIFITLSAVDASRLSRQTGNLKASLSIATKISELGTQNIAKRDRARAKAMTQIGQLAKRTTSVSVTDAVVSYTAQVGVGDPATNYTLLVDTGSAITFVGANNSSYTSTSASKNTGNAVSVYYGLGFWSGEEWLDAVTLTPGLVISQQSIGVANSSFGFNKGIDGILGVGPVDLTRGAVRNTETVPTVSDNLVKQGNISEEVLGVYFVPVSESSDTGKLTFGGYDESVITGSMNYVPLTTTSPASYYWGIDGSVSYDGTTILSTTTGIVDTGTTLILIPSDAFQKYQSVTGATMDSTIGFLSITPAQYDNLKPLTFNVGTQSYDLTPNGQIWPRSLNTAIGGNSTAIYLVVGNRGTTSGSGLDFTLGYTFLQRYYSIYDTTNGRVGFASTAYTNSTTN